VTNSFKIWNQMDVYGDDQALQSIIGKLRRSFGSCNFIKVSGLFFPPWV